MPSEPPLTYSEWNIAHGVTHAHCPNDCEHPQPFMFEGELVCGRCYFVHGKTVMMLPCTPEVCE